MKPNLVLRCAGIGAVLVLAGCGGSDDLSRTFGLTRDAPDEFTVTTRAPLSMPPDYRLRPPEPGAPRPQEQSTTQTAQVTIAGADALAAPAAPADSPGEEALLAAAGSPPPADIRDLVNAEAAKAASNRSLTDELLFWKSPPPPGVAVDPQKEAERLRTNAALGQSPDTGETPIIQKKNRNFLDTLF
jgi:hypothetical protein